MSLLCYVEMVQESNPNYFLFLGRIWVFQANEEPLELGTSHNVKGTDILAISEILSEITLTFSKDGQKLIFIDNRVKIPQAFETHYKGEPQVFTRVERRRFSKTSLYS